MAQITAAMVKELRDRTACGMMACKKALQAADGDMDKAIEHLRKSGEAKLAGKAHRSTNEGRIAIATAGNAVAMVEVVCETDFVAKNEEFAGYVDGLAARVAADCAGTGDLAEQVQAAEQENLVGLVTKIGENMQVRRVLRLTPTANAGTYVHMGGKIGVVVEVEGTDDEEYLKKLAMQVAANSPRFVAPEDVSAEFIAKEKEIAAAQPEFANKPAQVLDKILEGKIRKTFSEICLTKQTWLHDGETVVEKVKPEARIKCFVRWQVGEDL